MLVTLPQAPAKPGNRDEVTNARRETVCAVKRDADAFLPICKPKLIKTCYIGGGHTDLPTELIIVIKITITVCQRRHTVLLDTVNRILSLNIPANKTLFFSSFVCRVIG